MALTHFLTYIDQLTPAEREQVRAENLCFIEHNAVRSIEANVVYAAAIKAPV